MTIKETDTDEEVKAKLLSKLQHEKRVARIQAEVEREARYEEWSTKFASPAPAPQPVPVPVTPEKPLEQLYRDFYSDQAHIDWWLKRQLWIVSQQKGV